MFSSKSQNKKAVLPSASIHFSAPSSSVKPVGDPNKEERELMEESLGQKAKAFDFLQESDISKKPKETKRLRNYAKKDDGRMQAYGWSLSSKVTSKDLTNKGQGNNSQVSIPYPVHYGTLIDDDSNLKVSCSAAVKLGGGKTRDGGCIVGASIFYSGEKKDGSSEVKKQEKTEKSDEKNDDKSNKELEEISRELKDYDEYIEVEEKLSSLVWIATYDGKQSSVRVIDANKPSETIQNFTCSQTSQIICMTSVPGNCVEFSRQIL